MHIDIKKKKDDENIKVKSIKFNFIMNIILKLSSIIFPLITLPYVTRVLGTVGNGKVAFAVSVISYFSMFAQLGIPTYGIRICAKYRDDKDKLTKTVQEILVINTVSAIITYAVFAGCMLFIPKFQEEPVLLVINSLTIILNVLAMEWFYQSIEQYDYITVRNIFFKLLSLIALFLFIKNKEDYVLYGALSVIAASGSSLLNAIHARKYLLRKKYKNYNFRQHLKPIINFFLLSVSVSIYTNIDTVMLGFISGDNEVGLYNIATKIKTVLATMVSALGPVLLPRISYYIEKNNMKNVQELINKSVHVVIIASISVTIYFIVMATQTIDVLGGEEYYAAISCMQIIMFTIIPLGIGNVASMQILAPFNKEVKTMYSTVVGAIVNLVVNALLIGRLGAAGAAIGTVLAETAVTIIQVYYSWNIIGKAIRNVPYKTILVSTIVATVILIALKSILQTSSLVTLIITALVYYFIYAFILLLGKDKVVLEFMQILTNKITSRFKKNSDKA